MDDSDDGQMVFISYRNADWPFAHRLQERLEASSRGVVCIDRKIHTDDYERELLDKVRHCAVFLLIVTPRTLDEERVAHREDWIRREASLALALDKPIVPVLYEGQLFPAGPPARGHARTRHQTGDQVLPRFLRRGRRAPATSVQQRRPEPGVDRTSPQTVAARDESASPTGSGHAQEVAESLRTEVRVKLCRPHSKGPRVARRPRQWR